MTIDEKLKEASASVRGARQHAEFTVEIPGRPFTRSRVAVMIVAAAAALLVVGLPLVALNTSGGPENDVVTSESPPTTVIPADDTPVPTTAPPSASVDITGLVTGVVASSELSSAYGAEYLIDGDLDRDWQDASLRGVGAEITLSFDQPVAISEIVIYGLGDDVRFKRNFKVQGYTIRVDDQPEPVVGSLVNSNEAQVVAVGSSATTVLTLSVTTTHPAEAVGELPPFNELAIAEIRLFGVVPTEWSTPQTTIAPSDVNEPPPPVIDDASSRFEGPILDVSDGPFRWDPYVVNAMTGEGRVVLRGQIVDVNEAVMRDLGSMPLEFMSELVERGVYESATFLLLDGSGVLVSIWWQDWDGRAESKPLASPGSALLEEWGGDSVLIRLEEYFATFGAVNTSVLKFVGFEMLLTNDGRLPLTVSEAEMREIAAAVFEVIEP